MACVYFQEGFDEPAWYFESDDMCVYISGVRGEPLMSYSRGAYAQELLKTSTGEEFFAEFDEKKEVYALVDRTRNIEVRGLQSASNEVSDETPTIWKDALQANTIPEDFWYVEGISTWTKENSDRASIYDVSYSRNRNWENQTDAEYMVYASMLYNYYLETLGIIGFDNNGSLLRLALDKTIENNAVADYYYGYYDIDYYDDHVQQMTLKELEQFKVPMGIIRISPEFFTNPAMMQTLAHEYAHLLEMGVAGSELLIGGEETKMIQEGFADSMAELMDCALFNDEEWKNPFRDIANHVHIASGKEMPISIRENDYNPKAEKHFNSTIVSNTVYRLYKRGFATPEKMAEWLYRSLYYLNDHANFIQLRCALVNIADEMGLNSAMVAEEFNTAGIILKEYEPRKGTVTYRVRVLDSDSKQPLKNAIITFSKWFKEYEFYTDENGYADVVLKDSKTDINVYAGGYKDIDIKYKKGEYLNEVIIYLNKESEYYTEKSRLEGSITNSINKQFIQGATINFRNGVNIKSGYVCKVAKTDASGYYQVQGLPYGMYTMEIMKDGYVTKYQTIAIGNPLYNDTNCSIVLTPKMKDGELRIVLEWGENPRDLDSHLVCYNQDIERYHIYYGRKVYGEEAVLDTDEVYGKGPETITVQYNNDYTYRYYVHWYAGEGSLQTSGANVEVYYCNELIGEFTIDSQANYAREWPVFTFKDGVIY